MADNTGIRNTYLRNSSQSSNILRTVANHERGILRKKSLEFEVTKMKVRQLERSEEEFEIDPDISYCKFVKNCDNGCLIGVWQKNMDPASKHSSVYHLKFEYSDQNFRSLKNDACPIVSNVSCNGPFFRRMDVTDSCEQIMKDKSCLVYVGNTAVSGGRIVLNITDMDESSTDISEIIWRSPKYVWSCASNALTERFAVGTETGCFIFDLKNFMDIENLKTNVLAVEFSKDGQSLYCGKEEGEPMLYDLREGWAKVGFKFFDGSGINGIKEMKLLSDETSLIICGTDGKLWKTDLRMKRPVFQYPEFVNKMGGRTPLSIDEGLDLLCATGDDNNSRIWSLQSGDLLRTIYPFDDTRTNSHACLVADQRRWFVAVVQANILSVLHH